MDIVRGIALLFGLLCISTVLVFITPGLYESIQAITGAPLYESNQSMTHQKNATLRRYRISGQRELQDTEFTAAERSHLQDVKRNLWKVAGTGMVVIGICIFLMGSNRFLLKQASSVALRVVVAIVLIIGILLLTGYFTETFELFHRIFFTDNRTFSSDSLLIQLFPESFFISGFFLITILTILFLSFISFCTSERIAFRKK